MGTGGGMGSLPVCAKALKTGTAGLLEEGLGEGEGGAELRLLRGLWLFFLHKPWSRGRRCLGLGSHRIPLASSADSTLKAGTEAGKAEGS